jgi:hypothetical protein
MPLSAVRFTQYYFDIVVRRSKRLATLTSVMRGRSAIYIRTSHRPHIRRSFRQGGGHDEKMKSLFLHDFLIAFVLTLLIGGMLLSAVFFLAKPQPAMEAKKSDTWSVEELQR